MRRMDIAVYDRNQQLILAVEIKKLFGVSKKKAATLRRDLRAHSFYPKTTFFLLVTPEKFFLWRDENNSLEETLPDYEESASDILKPYFDRVGVLPEQLNEAELEMLVANWLNDVLFPIESGNLPKWLVESGLAQALYNGKYKFDDLYEVAV